MYRVMKREADYRQPQRADRSAFEKEAREDVRAGVYACITLELPAHGALASTGVI